MKHNLYRITSVGILTLAVIFSGGLIKIQAQDLPDAAALPDGKGAWVADLFVHSNVINGYASAMPNNTRILVQSDGTVFRRKIIQYREFANDSGWCQDKFTVEEMKPTRTAIEKFKPGTWKDNYGPLPNALAPFGSVTITMRSANGKAVDYAIKLFRFDNLPAGLADLFNKVSDAGDLAFSNCGGNK